MKTGKPIIGCVSFLNARPLIDRLDERDDYIVRYDVPSALLEDLQQRRVDVALCPVIDYQLANQPLAIIPSGGIGCDGPTLTVRIYSRQPIEQTTLVHADTHSHSSIALMRIILHDAYNLTPQVRAYRADASTDHPDTMLLIGDKVVTHAPDPDRYPHQLDLGEAWKNLTGLPFVFAVWMMRLDVEPADLPETLTRTRIDNAKRIDELVQTYAPIHNWPAELARQYLGQYLRYEIGPRQLQAMRRFWTRAHDLGLTPRLEPLRLAGAPSGAELCP